MIFRLSHIAVILSLIVATMIQPMALGMAGIACAEKCETSPRCQGCGCCEVSTAGTPCGCCADKASPTTASPTNAANEASAVAASCCHDSSPAAKSDAANFRTESNDNDRIAEAATVEKTTKSSKVSACLCGVTTQPLGESTPRPPVNELRNLDVLSYLVRVIDAEAVGATVYPDGDIGGTHLLAAHYSQRVLCIWRL
ncbi:hypothetical protein [Novipirellula sp.]|uniref:hypothetical protein n=1 Tax=Novipirellula sp. TaxID=2795430 RepID=UPI00356A4C5B